MPGEGTVSYSELFERGELKRRAALLKETLEPCTVCPRECGALRRSGERGECGAGDGIEISSFGPHFGEEAPLVGSGGSGTLFFAFCSLRCVFCQNHEISRGKQKYTVTAAELAGIMLELQRRGCANINLVTPTHYTPQIVEALLIAAEGGLQLPLVYNCGGYEKVETLRLLEGIVDIYMPDLKYAGEEAARKYSGINHYPAIARQAIMEMHRQVGDLEVDNKGAALKGLLIRHLVMPENLGGTTELMEFVARQISPNSWINIMDQYHPAYLAQRYPEINRRITRREYLDALAGAGKAGPGFNLL